MIAPRGYLIVAAVLLLVKAVQLGTGLSETDLEATAAGSPLAAAARSRPSAEVPADQQRARWLGKALYPSRALSDALNIPACAQRPTVSRGLDK
jgi:hypothetical protein